MWFLYELLLVLAFLLYVPGAVLRRRLPHRGWRMRLGRFRPDVTNRLATRPSLWVHAVSVGEVLAARPMVRALSERHPRHPLVLSTITPSGFGVARQHLGRLAVLIYFPLDLRACVRRTLDVLQPGILLLMESELWPMVLQLTKARGVPIAVVNGRISPRAFRRYRRVRPWLGPLWRRVDLFLMQSQTDADRAVALGAPPDRVRVTGNLKWDASVGARPTAEAVRAAAAQLGLAGSEPVITAGSTHRGEERILLDVFAAVRQRHPALRLLIAPRHLERLDDVETLVQAHGLRSLRTSKAAGASAWDVALVDTFGQLPTYYSLARMAFVGGSLVPHGGQNPLEPAGLGKPVVFGPHMHNFSDISRQLLEARAACQVAGPNELAAALETLLGDPAAAEAMGARTQALTAQASGATQRTLDFLTPLLTAFSTTT